MKFFHLSDLHIGLRLIHRDLLPDQRHVLGQIIEAAGRERPDAVVIAGDIYDKSIPSAEAVTVFDEFISGLARAAEGAEIMIISGNHDNAARLNLFRDVLRRQRVHMIGMPPTRPEDRIERITLRDGWGPVHFYLLPFVKPSMVRGVVGSDDDGDGLSYDEAVRRLIARERIDTRERNVLVSHQFYCPAGTPADRVAREESEIRAIGNIDQVSSDALDGFDYAALGHLHRPMCLGSGRLRYCGTPLACSVGEAGQRKGIVAVELGEKGSLQTRVIPLQPLRQIRVVRGTLDEVLEQGCGDYATVILTDQVDLDVIDMRDRLAQAFPFLLEIRREGLQPLEPGPQVGEEALSPLELCLGFLGDADEEAREILRDVINTVREVN